MATDDETLVLVQAISDAGWNPGSTCDTPVGKSVEFYRLPHTFDGPGVVKRTAAGKTTNDAYHAFLKELNDEQDESTGD